jgi:hypothetical protein
MRKWSSLKLVCLPPDQRRKMGCPQSIREPQRGHPLSGAIIE